MKEAQSTRQYKHSTGGKRAATAAGDLLRRTPEEALLAALAVKGKRPARRVRLPRERKQEKISDRCLRRLVDVVEAEQPEGEAIGRNNGEDTQLAGAAFHQDEGFTERGFG